MSNNTNRQFGFTMIETLLLVISVSLIAGMGYMIWSSQQQADKLNAVATSVQDAKAKVSVTSAADTQAELKTAVVNYNVANSNNSDDAKTLIVSVNKDNQSFAIGGVASPQGGSADEWFAKKVNGTWTIVAQGTDELCAELAQNGLSDWSKGTCKE